MTRHDMTRRVEGTAAMFGDRFTILPHQAYDAIGAHAAVPDDRVFSRSFIERWSAA